MIVTQQLQHQYHLTPRHDTGAVVSWLNPDSATGTRCIQSWSASRQLCVWQVAEGLARHVKQAAQAVKPLTSLFGGMYLASLGLIMSPGYIGAHVGAISAHVACVFGLKLGVVGLTMRALGFSWSAALAAGATLAQISEVSLFMVARAQQLGLLSRGAFSHTSREK